MEDNALCVHGEKSLYNTMYKDEKTYIFVLSFFACCKNCDNVAPDVFSIEKDFGKARVYNQYGDLELVQQAIESW